MNKVYKVAIDMDGVLCNWRYQVKTMTGKSETEWRSLGIDEHFLWPEVSKYGEFFWSQMPWMPDGKELFQFIRENFQDCFILSAQAKHVPVSATGKIKWVRREIGLIPVTICNAVDKQIFASENVILVDDSERNINQWKDRGGFGIFHLNARETIGVLKKLI